MPATVLLAGRDDLLAEVAAGGSQPFTIVARARTLDEAREAMRALRPSVLVLDPELAGRDGLCSLPSLRRSSPDTAIVIPPAGQAGPRLVRAVRMAAGDGGRRRRADGLTARERDVVRLISLGHTNREVADRLVLSVRTVEMHRARVQRRLRLRGRAQLVRWALERGLLSP
jgi:two-component system, NarL family, response regulator NreC